MSAPPPEGGDTGAELRRMESDPAYRALFLTLLEAALARRNAERGAFALGALAAAERLRGLVRPDPDPAARRARADRRSAMALTVGAIAWTCCVAGIVARGWLA
ncbi:hypothetical protein ACFWBC_34760 [Streptomyces sp. NPDC059985]|uniref:hypothetical protein n=1 Tax=Streptomyces sp. NPDC059985 TaxID=3347025 RepID=UPI0036C18329